MAFRRLSLLGLGKEKEYVLQNISLLVGSGMDILSTLQGVRESVVSRRMRAIMDQIRSDVQSGLPFWRALEESGLFPPHIIALTRIGEQSGQLAENLQVIALQHEKDRMFHSKLRSAMMYPVFVLVLTMIVGIGIAWFILPRLAGVFSSLDIELPAITRGLIAVGNFFSADGPLAVPHTNLALGLLGYFVFVFKKTKFIGQFILLHTPGIGALLKDIELGRFGYIMGTLLGAGFTVLDALDALKSSTSLVVYQTLYHQLSDSLSEGNSFKKNFAAIRGLNRLIPLPIQQMIIAGEQSGKLGETFMKIGQSYEAKTETMTKDLAVILEPVLLVIVWLGVVSVALAVILPIYSLIGGLQH